MMPLSAEMQRVGWRARAGVRSTGRHLDRPGNISGRRSRSRPLDRLSSGRTSVQGGPITPGRNRSIATRRILGLVLAREDEPFRGETPGQRRVCVQNRLFDAKGLSASVDRQPIPVSQARFSIVSRDFRFTSVSGNPAIGKAVFRTQHQSRRVAAARTPPDRRAHDQVCRQLSECRFSLSVTYCLTVA